MSYHWLGDSYIVPAPSPSARSAATFVSNDGQHMRSNESNDSAYCSAVEPCSWDSSYLEPFTSECYEQSDPYPEIPQMVNDQAQAQNSTLDDERMLPPSWETELDFITNRRFFVHPSTGHSQLFFPKAGDEYALAAQKVGKLQSTNVPNGKDYMQASNLSIYENNGFFGTHSEQSRCTMVAPLGIAKSAGKGEVRGHALGLGMTSLNENSGDGPIKLDYGNDTQNQARKRQEGSRPTATTQSTLRKVEEPSRDTLRSVEENQLWTATSAPIHTHQTSKSEKDSNLRKVASVRVKNKRRFGDPVDVLDPHKSEKTAKSTGATVVATIKAWGRRVRSVNTRARNSFIRSNKQASEPPGIPKPLQEQHMITKPPVTLSVGTEMSPVSKVNASHQQRDLRIGEPGILPKLDQVPNEVPLSDPVEEKRVVADRRITPQDSFSSDTTCPEDETDWAGDSDSEDFDPEMFRRLCVYGDNEHTVSPGLVQALMDPAKVELVDRIMGEFWTIFNQDWATNMRQCSPGSTSRTNSGVSSNQASEITTSKHSREMRDDSPSDKDDKSRGAKRPRMVATSSVDLNETLKFACPYRKRDPRKYNVQNWRPCALTPHKTVARVKGHLYRYHTIHQCARCKDLFKSQEELDTHIESIQGCGANPNPGQVEGITSKIKERLQCRKKAHPGQTEAERWKNIYNILFPNEEAPGPYFEPLQDLQDQPAQSTDSREVASYEDYLRREVPRFVRSALETAVNNEVEPIEERLRLQIMSLIEEAQNRAFSSYHAMHRSAESSVSTPSREEPNLGSFPPLPSGSSENIFQTFYQPPPPQTHLEFTTTLSDFDIPLRHNDARSDSGYVSSRSRSGTSSHEGSQQAGNSSTAPRSIIIPTEDELTSLQVDLQSGGSNTTAPSSVLLPPEDDLAFFDDALHLNGLFPEGSWTVDSHHIDMDQFDLNNSWTSNQDH